MIRFAARIFFVLLSCFVLSSSAGAQTATQKNILILVEGNTDLKNYAMGDGRQLAALLGHFNVKFTLKGVNEYAPGEMKRYDRTFYIGFQGHNSVPASFAQDVLTLDTRIFWLNTGFEDFSKRYPAGKQFGFTVSHIDSLSNFDEVRFGSEMFTKGEPNINTVVITNRRLAEVQATAFSTKRKKEVPYIITSGNLTYIADSPFANATESDRYILFADLLHEYLGENHEQSHSAIIRIEDVSPLDNPDHLREIADILSAKGIPFAVGVIPFYVDPGQGVHVSLSDKPDLVDALKVHDSKRRDDCYAWGNPSVQGRDRRGLRVLGRKHKQTHQAGICRRVLAEDRNGDPGVHEERALSACLGDTALYGIASCSTRRSRILQHGNGTTAGDRRLPMYGQYVPLHY